MTVENFISEYKNIPLMNRDKYLEDLIKTKYIPFTEKVDVCKLIIESTCYTKNENGEQRIHIRSYGIYLFFTMFIIDKYTDIDVDLKNAAHEYDLLNKEDKLIKQLYTFIPEEEIAEFNMVLDMVKDDFMNNEYQIGNYISNRLDNFAKILGTVLSPALDKLSSSINEIDDKKVGKILEVIKNSKILNKIKK